ncbi:hypothetical protein N0V82_005403 [Gnomoniopsis sp. IMI 355080]|nr:hypothetical protein N0V82_005403 [Gnomoniopsis sp. IMI 355080]
MDFYSSDDELEVLDNFVPPSERKAKAAKPKTPSRKRPASNSSAGCNGSPAAKKTPNSVSVKREKSEASTLASKNAPKIVFGLDFGTTYSGVAYACLDKLDQISVLMDLDDSNNDNPKVPSAVQFARSQFIWGDPVDKSAASTIEWFKLLLVDEDDLPEEVRTSGHVMKARDRLRELGMTCEEVIASYLDHLWKNCLKKVKKEVGAVTVDRSRFHVVVTLPAICEYTTPLNYFPMCLVHNVEILTYAILILDAGPDYSRERMMQAVRAAGILEKRLGVADTVLTFVAEPEAAALATLKRIDGRCDVEPGDSFVVCDCGGGTVDLIAYRVNTIEPMTIREIVKGAGALAGAVFVDARFNLLLKKKFDEVNPILWDHISAKDMDRIISEDWQSMRRKFTVVWDKDFSIVAPMSLYEAGLLDITKGRVTIQITAKDLNEVFRPVLEKIETLVFGQVHSVLKKEGKMPKVNCGSYNPALSLWYLYEWLEKHIGDSGIEILQSEGAEPWSAICRGAVIHGMTVEKVDSPLSVEIRSRVARASYGIVCREAWDPTKHSIEDKIFDPQQQLWKATNQMKWLINEGDDLATDKKFRHDFYRLVDVDEIPDSLSTTLWMCRTSPPPSRKEKSVVKYSEMKWTANIHWSKLPKRYNTVNDEFYEVEFQAVMQCSSGVTDLAVLHKGRKQATKNVQVEFFDRADL